MSSAVHWQNTHYDLHCEHGGVINISVCDDAEDTLECHAETLAVVLDLSEVKDLLRVVPFEIDERTFHGSCFDYSKQLLRHHGAVNTGPGGYLDNPYYKDIWRNLGGSHYVPSLWSPGEFAFAFCRPAYSLSMDPLKIQQTYMAIVSKIVPRNQCRILSWQKEGILNVAPWLWAGTSWWGVYVFSVYNKATSQVFGIAAADTD